MNWAQYTFFLFNILDPIVEQPSLDKPKEVKQVSLKENPINHQIYVSCGGSFWGPIPYFVNMSLGSRYTKNGSLFGVDTSLNYSTNVVFHSLSLKEAVPFYFQPSKAKNSLYMGPYIAVSQDFPVGIRPSRGGSGFWTEKKNPAPDFEGGVVLGRNYGDQEIEYFTQSSFRGFLIQDGEFKPYYFLTFKIDAGIAF
jgi:hypothetical protein